MTTLIHPQLEQKLNETRAKYKKVTAFSKLLPMFAKTIIFDELTGEDFSQLAYRHKKLYLAWGINWYTNTPTNYPTKNHSEVGFVCVYINCISLFGDDLYTFAHEQLFELLPNIQVHFYDNLNSTFYFLPSEVEVGLDKLNEWYENMLLQCDAYTKKKRKAELERQLEELSK